MEGMVHSTFKAMGLYKQKPVEIDLGFGCPLLLVPKPWLSQLPCRAGRDVNDLKRSPAILVFSAIYHGYMCTCNI